MVDSYGGLGRTADLDPALAAGTRRSVLARASASLCHEPAVALVRGLELRLALAMLGFYHAHRRRKLAVHAIGIVRRAASAVRTAKMGSDNTASVGPTRGLELPAARRAG